MALRGFARELDDAAIAAYMSGAADPILGFLAEERGLAAEAGRIREAIAAWSAFPDRNHELRADFGSIFLVGANLGAPPYASIYLDPAGRMLQAPHERMVQRLAGAELEVRRDLREPADHLAVMLEYLALLLERFGTFSGPVEGAAEQFIRSELLTWIAALRGRAGRVATRSDFHHACIVMTAGYLTTLADALGDMGQ